MRLRANDACEYCLHPTVGQFHIDHIIPADVWVGYTANKIPGLSPIEGRRGDQEQLVNRLPDAHVRIERQDAGHMPPAMHMIYQMPRHGFAIVRDQDEAGVLAPAEDIRIQSTAWWRVGVSDQPDGEIGLLSQDLCLVERVDMLIQ